MAENLPTVERAERELMKLLASGRVRSGDRLVESRLAEELGLNRAAVREALNRLVTGEVVEYVPYSGYRLKVFGPNDLLELLELREAIEPIAARSAAELGDRVLIDAIEATLVQFEESLRQGDSDASWRYDCEFHAAIVKASGNSRFVRLYKQMRIEPSMMPWVFDPSVQHQYKANSEDPYSGSQATLEAHWSMFRAIRERRPFEARDIAAEHVFWTKDGFIRFHLPRLSRQASFDKAAE